MRSGQILLHRCIEGDTRGFHSCIGRGFNGIYSIICESEHTLSKHSAPIILHDCLQYFHPVLPRGNFQLSVLVENVIIQLNMPLIIRFKD